MDPALAARIEASVRGRKRQPGAPRLSPRLVALVRVSLVLAVAFVGYSVVGARRRDRREIERTRAELLATVRTHAASLTPEDRGSVVRAESWLVRFAGAYDGDLVADEIRAPDALKATLARPAMYVRGQLGSFVSPAGIAEAAATSLKDALLLCLVEPPASKTEKVLLATVRIAYAGGAAMEDHTANVRRLNDAVVGLPLLTPQWSERVLATDEPTELARFRRELDRGSLERAKQAARAGLLVFAMDEPSDGGGPTELDGERAHAIRIGVVDLASAKILLRMRKQVDPSWISPAKKSEYAIGLDSCGLAFDVHEAARTPVR
jgi:hypothetical protein